MQPYEISIGNNVMAESKVVTVNEILLQMYSNKDYCIAVVEHEHTIELADVSGIPLTKEWIYNLGFMYSNDLHTLPNTPKKKEYKKKGTGVTVTISENGIIRVLFGIGTIECEYVHQLQNLITAIKPI